MISIAKWKKFQHYGKERPPWIKLYRDTLGEYEIMYQLTPEERWVLVGLWMLAAETGNEIPNDVGFLGHRLRADVTTDLLKKLKDLGLIELGASSRPTLEEPLFQTEAEKRREEAETETEAYKNNGPSADVEKSSEESEPTPAVELPAYTEGYLLEEANNVLGLKVLDRDETRANRSILRHWLYKRPPIPSEEVYAAIHGLRWMVDTGRPEVSEWLSPKRPIGLRALNNTETLFDQGDGKAKRVLFDVAVELYQRAEERKTVPRGKGPSTIAQTIARMGAA